MNDVSDIISKYDSVIEKMISLYRVRAKLYGVDPDDLRQDCRIELWNCLKKKPESDPCFLPYIRVSLRKRIRTTLIKKSEGCSHQNFYKQKRVFIDVSDMVEQAMPEDVSHESLYSYTDSTEENIVIKDFIGYCTKCSPIYGNIVENRLRGFTADEVARMIGVNEKTVDRKIVDIRDLYRKYFGVEIDEQNNTLASNKPRIG